MRNGRWPWGFAPRRWHHLVVPCVLLALVALLATLQYQWVGQLGDAERQRMRTSAQARADQFAEDFDSTLTGLFLSFSQLNGVPPSSPPAGGASVRPPPTALISEDDVSQYANEFARWAATSPHARLVRALYLLRTSASGSDLQKLAPGRGFEPAAWPPDLAPLKSSFERGGNDRSRSLFPQAAPAIPALLVPITRLRVTDLGSEPGRVRIVNFVSVTGSLIVQLDRDYMRREWFPALARRYFGEASGFDYNLAVVNSASRSVVYASNPALGAAAFAKPDVRTPLFRLRLDQVGRMMAGSPAGKAPADSVRFSISTRRDTAVVSAGGPPAEWDLVLEHRAGSLEAAIARSRHRNLAISFGILALLAGSLGLIVLSARRASNLARQQIEFVAGVSHELRTPLSVIRSAGENLSDGVIAEPAQVKRYGALIAGEGRRLTDLVEQVMSFAGFESGRELRDRTQTTVADLIDAAVAATSPLIVQHGFTLDRRVGPDLPTVTVNSAAVTRAIENLISNAVKYSGPSRWIGVRAEAAAAPRGREVRIIVEDRGIGIPHDEQRRIFEPFYRGRGVLASAVRGSGLGLSLARRVIEAHGGSIGVRSEPGQGSAFTLHLPCEPAGAMA